MNLDEIYEMQKWKNSKLLEELSRPCTPEDRFQYSVMREALSRILMAVTDEGEYTEPTSNP